MQEPFKPTEADIKIARTINSVPAPYVNKTFVTSFPTGMRLTFTEVNPGSPDEEIARAAVLMSYDDIEALITLLRKQIDTTTKKIDISNLVPKQE